MNYIIVDFEMNPIAREYKAEKAICRSEIIEIGAIILNDELTILGEYKTLVKPQYSTAISKKYESLTGISTHMVDGAPLFEAAYESFVCWRESYGDDYEIYAWSENDYKQLIAEMQLKKYDKQEMMRPLERWNDFQLEYTQKLGLERALSLDQALSYAAVDFAGMRHDALCDARNTAKLFAIVRDEGRKNTVLKSVLDALRPKNVGGTLGDRIDFGALMMQIA